MTVTANLTAGDLKVQPGQEVRCPLLVRNTGTIVDQFTFEALGPAGPWIAVEPASVSLFPGAEETVQVCFRPPRGSTVGAGLTPFAIKVIPRDAPGDSVVEEGDIDVLPFAETSVELIPRTARGSTRGRFEAAIDQRGNAAVNATFAGADDGNLLRFAFRPPGVTAHPGQAVFARFLVRPAHTFWFGEPRSHPFQLTADLDGGPPLTAQGTYIQDPRLPTWVPKAAIAALAAIIALAALWFGVVKPKVRDYAKQAAQQQVQQNIAGQVAAGVAAGVKGAGGPGAGGAAAGGGGAAGGGAAGGGAAGGGATATTAAPKAQSVSLPPGPVLDGRLALAGPGTVSFSVPANKSFQVTDLILENSKGDTGSMSIQRSGTPLMVLQLDNFRDLDYHFISPLVFPTGTQLQLSGACSSADCTPAVYYVGYTLSAPPGT